MARPSTAKEVSCGLSGCHDRDDDGGERRADRAASGRAARLSVRQQRDPRSGGRARGRVAAGGGRGRALAVAHQPDHVGAGGQHRSARVRRAPAIAGRDRPVAVVPAAHPGRDPRGRRAKERRDPGARCQHPPGGEAWSVAGPRDGVAGHARRTARSRDRRATSVRPRARSSMRTASATSFFKRFHNLDEELPTHYDLVVNTDVLSPEGSARVIAHAAANA